MKKNIKIAFFSFICLFCLLLNVGCSCSRPISVKYAISVEGDAASNIDVRVTLYQKYREPANTPCYKKMKAGYVKLTSREEINDCVNGNCYVKSGKEYVEANTQNIYKCLIGDMSCYEKVEQTYYKLVEDPEVYKCVDQYGNSFERVIYNKNEKSKIDEVLAVSSQNQSNSYESDFKKLSKTKTYSYIYEFEIKNYSENVVKVNSIDKAAIVGDILTLESENKVKVTPLQEVTLQAYGTTKITVEVKYMTKEDIDSKVVKYLALNIHVVANIVPQE